QGGLHRAIIGGGLLRFLCSHTSPDVRIPVYCAYLIVTPVQCTVPPEGCKARPPGCQVEAQWPPAGPRAEGIGLSCAPRPAAPNGSVWRRTASARNRGAGGDRT